MTNILLEASIFRKDILKQIDIDFENIKRDNTNIKAKKLLISHIKEFTGIKKVYLSIKRSFNGYAGIVPIYNNSLFNDKSDDEDSFLKPLNSDNRMDEDNAKYISKIYLIFGMNLINTSSPKELTAILLHEIGHACAHTTNFSNIIRSLIKKYLPWASGLSTISMGVLAKWIGWASVKFLIPIILTFFTITHVISIVDRMEEKDSDKFAVKYGYGDELISVMDRFRERGIKINKSTSFLEKALKVFINFILPMEHPSPSTRICNIMNHMIDEYKDLYPELSDDLNVILADVKCKI